MKNEDDQELTIQESTDHFILTMVNDCFNDVEIERFQRGLRLFQQLIQDEYQKSFDKLNPYQHILLLNEIVNSPIYPESLKFFVNATKQLTVRHYTTSKYYMEEKMDYEFAPGRYLGSVRT